MTIENLGNGSVVDEDGDVVPIDAIADAYDALPPENSEIIALEERARRDQGRDIFSLAATAARAMEHQVTRQPRSIGEVIQERKRLRGLQPHGGVEREDAYVALGGGLASSRDSDEKELPLDNVIEEYEPWKHDIRRAVEQYGVADFSVQELVAMKDFETYSLHFYGYMENITTSIRLIQAVDGETENDQYLNSKYGKLPPDEALAYANTLTWLKHDLEETGVPRAARAALGLPAEGAVPMEQRTKVLAKLQADRHRHKLKNIRITKAKKSLSIERTNETF